MILNVDKLKHLTNDILLLTCNYLYLRQMRKFLLLFFISISFIAQASVNSLIDSLEKKIPSANDSDKTIIMTKLVSEYSTINPEKAAEYCSKAVALAERSHSPYLKVVSLISECAINNTRSNFDQSLELALKAQKIADQARNNELIARCYVNTGYIYQKLHDYKTSLDFFYKASRLVDFLPDKKIIGNLYNNFGNSFYELKQLDSAMIYHKKALEVRLKINDKRGISYSYNNIGNVYIEKKDASKALEYYVKSIAIKQEIGDKKGIAGGNINISSVYSDMKIFDMALRSAEKGVAQAEEIHADDFLLDGYQSAGRACEGLGDFKKEADYLRKYIALKDSIYSENLTVQIAEMQSKYEADKKQKEIELTQRENELANAKVSSLEAQNKQKNTLIGGAILGVVLLIILVGFVFRSYKIKQRTNDQLEISNNQLQHLNEIINKRTEEIERQSAELRAKNKDITDSIVYAQRIQTAIMPPIDDLKKTIPKSFIYYQPRDIVSGDFYWFYQSDELFVIACADCTGHGVPGAFMSMICVQLLNLVIRDSHVTATEQALGMLDDGVRTALRQSGGDRDTTDGMDIALCALDLKKNTIQYSGAYRPLYVIRNNELIEVPANKFSIGGFRNVAKNFKGSKIELEKGDKIYLFTDGYADQFGGPHGKKFMMKNFKKLLLSICDKPIQEQHLLIDKTMDEWKKDFDQLDDILVIGMEI